MHKSIFFVKSVHSIIFLFLGACILFVLYSTLFNQITLTTWIAIIIVLTEGIILAMNGWSCPLTTYAENLGAESGSVTDIFLPKWFADRVFSICGGVFVLTFIILLARLLIGG